MASVARWGAQVNNRTRRRHAFVNVNVATDRYQLARPLPRLPDRNKVLTNRKAVAYNNVKLQGPLHAPRDGCNKGVKLMKVVGFIACLFVVLGFSQFGCGKPVDTRPPVTPLLSSASPEKPRVDTAAIEKELIRIERDYPRVVKEKDVAALKRTEAEDLVVIDQDGNIGSHAENVKDIESGAVAADSWEVTDLKVTVLNADAAFISGRSIIKGGKTSVQIRWIDTYARRDGSWKLVASISTPVKQPPASTPPKS
jgi:hypothetical protein